MDGVGTRGIQHSAIPESGRRLLKSGPERAGRAGSRILPRAVAAVFGRICERGKVISDVAGILPLAEVLNNEGVAVSREGRDGTALFVRAAAADPNTADYHFNLAVSLK